ncbi:uncharacterized protein LOC122507452 [Leptopilina heterotoma]|uniref:uncharacterized protein LOC122507452 n=1 Tax=Leptopilina heterotoma TaxID=63436 RepID=UPI001CA8EE5C|nr:uncharacterized protein LOC122507452 [Leptopilina heterotoma]
MSEKKIFSAQDERLNALHKRILEIKKKIHLSEGQRKSWFEDCNSRNKENIQKIVVLKKENKILQAEPKNFNVDQNTECNSILNNINPTDSKKIITNYEKEKHDESILRLRKKIDYLIWNKEKKKNTLCKILNSYKKVKNKKLKHAWKELGFAIKQKIVNLENQLQCLNIMQMEADTINKKYKSVRVSLNLDAACYNSSLCKLEENNSDIADEVTRLEEAKAGALYLRDYTKNILDTQESSTMIISNDWDKIIISYRKKVDDRKLEFDRIERAIYPTVLLASEDNCDAYKAQEIYDEKVSVPLAIKLRKAIVNLQNAAEVTEKKDVLNQFFKQRSLKQKLQNIRSETEGEKILLENKRQVLSTEVEIKKFADAEDTNQRNEELINILELAGNEKVRQRIIIQKNRNIQDMTRIIFVRFRKLYTKIPNFLISDSLKQLTSPIEYLQKVKDIIENQINISPAIQGHFVKEPTVINKQEDVPNEKENSSVKDRQEGEQLFPLFYNTSALVVPQVQLSEDEDEIASRSFIKKQAQFLVDTKSRRKGFAFKRSAIM